MDITVNIHYSGHARVIADQRWVVKFCHEES